MVERERRERGDEILEGIEEEVRPSHGFLELG